MTAGRQTTLDVARGIAILLVLLFHLKLTTGNAAVDTALAPLIGAGWVGVDLFFVLSGFLVGRLILIEAGSSRAFDRRRFIVRRILRLWPVLFLYLAATVLVGGRDGVALVWPVLLHIQNYATHIPSHLWSLAVEEQFYFIAALLLPILVRRRAPEATAVALIVVIAAAMSLRMGAWLIGVTAQHLQWQTQYRADAIAIGVLIGWIECHRPELFARIMRQRMASLAVALAGLMIVATIKTNSLRFGPGLIAADIGSAALILCLYRATIPGWLTVPSRALVWLGAIAYPLYLWHPAIARVADEAAPMVGVSAPIGLTALRYIASIAVATIVSVLIERPFMRLRDGRSSVRRSRTSAAISLLLLRTRITDAYDNGFTGCTSAAMALCGVANQPLDERRIGWLARKSR